MFQEMTRRCMRRRGPTGPGLPRHGGPCRAGASHRRLSEPGAHGPRAPCWRLPKMRVLPGSLMTKAGRATEDGRRKLRRDEDALVGFGGRRALFARKRARDDRPGVI